MGEELERLLLKLTTPEAEAGKSNSPIKKPGILGSLQKFLKALSQ